MHFYRAITFIEKNILGPCYVFLPDYNVWTEKLNLLYKPDVNAILFNTSFTQLRSSSVSALLFSFTANIQHLNMHIVSLISMAIVSVAGLMAVSVVLADTLPQKSEGIARIYDPFVPSSCGASNPPTAFVAGIGDSYFTTQNPNKDPLCGKCIKVTSPSGSVKVHIMDKCMVCGRDDVVLSEAALNAIGGIRNSTLLITWEASNCF
ncbi:hypothetical protein BDF19DRAFT_437299 [Syncephalis fuscata]|nr:hypothetical protein BDF19DRAFT_437299 [Syncephalis fuscata]